MAAIVLRDDPPPVGLDIDEPGIAIALPFDRPLYQRPVVADVDSLIPPNTAEVDADVLFAQSFIDQTRLIANIQAAMPHGTAALLSDIVALHPIEQGAAEIVGYLALEGDELSVDMDDTESSTLDFVDPANPEVTKIARLPKVTVRRR